MDFPGICSGKESNLRGWTEGEVKAARPGAGERGPRAPGSRETGFFGRLDWEDDDGEV